MFFLYYFLILCSYFHLLFLTLLVTRYILQFTMFDPISLQPARKYYGDKKNFIVHDKNKYHVNYNQSKSSNKIIFWIKYELFLPPYQITFFLAFGQAKIFFSYHIFTSILIYILFCDKKNISILFHTENYHWTANNIPK